MYFGGSCLQDYDDQVAVDSDYRMIVAAGVSNEPSNVQDLEPALDRIACSAGARPDLMTMNIGYWSEDNAESLPLAGQRRLHLHRPSPWPATT